MGTHTVEPFQYDEGTVEPGTSEQIRYKTGETYLGDPIEIPVTVLCGHEPGPTVFLAAAMHGDELNGVAVVRRAARRWNAEELAGTLVCVHVLNVPGFLAQQRYLPLDDSDLNRSFPGKQTGTAAQRMVDHIFQNFIQPCDFGLDFHTSTRGRTNVFHVRADMDDSAVERLARAFGSNVIISSRGPSGSLRRIAVDDGIPTITIEMGEAQRFQQTLIDDAVAGIRSVLCEYDIHPRAAVRWGGWRAVISGSDEKTWLRADEGGIVDMHCAPGSLLQEGDIICTIADAVGNEKSVVEAPFSGLVVGILENPVVYSGNPLCHLVQLRPATQRAIEQEAATLNKWDE